MALNQLNEYADLKLIFRICTGILKSNSLFFHQKQLGPLKSYTVGQNVFMSSSPEEILFYSGYIFVPAKRVMQKWPMVLKHC